MPLVNGGELGQAIVGLTVVGSAIGSVCKIVGAPELVGAEVCGLVREAVGEEFWPKN